MKDGFQLKKDLRALEITSVTQGALLVLLWVGLDLRKNLSEMSANPEVQSALGNFQYLAVFLLFAIVAAILGVGFWKRKIRVRILGD